MKKLLIIQTDEAYFLFETLQVLEKNTHAFKNFELTILVREKSLTEIMDKSVPLLRGITFQSDNLLLEKFDLSVNLSLNEESWNYHSRVNSHHKIGAYIQEGQIRVDDLWSTYLLTLKARAPFLTFHLQDVYRNILGLKGRISEKLNMREIKEIAIGTAASHLFPVSEQEIFIQTLSEKFPRIPLKDISEIDLVDEVSETLYIGPASLDALKFCEAGGKGIFLTSAFQGFNLIPYGSTHKILSSRGSQFKALPLLKYVENEITNHQHGVLPYSVYHIDNENIFGPSQW